MAGMDKVCYDVLFQRYPTCSGVLPMLMRISFTDPEASLLDQSRTNKDQIDIVTDADGNPAIPSVVFTRQISHQGTSDHAPGLLHHPYP